MRLKESIPHCQKNRSNKKIYGSIIVKLHDLYRRPHIDKCELNKWIDFQFLQFNIMYHSRGIIQMDKYRTNAVNNCYCFVVLVIVIQMWMNKKYQKC